MGLLDLFRQSFSSGLTPDRRELVARYNRMRQVNRLLNNKLLTLLRKRDFELGARKLGMLHGNTFVFNTEDESAVLMDYCLYDVRTRGRNAIEQYLIESPPDQDSDEMTCLHAMQHATYSLFVVESVERGVGLMARDIRTEECLLVVDLSLSTTAKRGLVFASRLLRYDGYAILTGSALPIGFLTSRETEAWAKKLRSAGGDLDSAVIIRRCLELGASEHVEYRSALTDQEGSERRPSARP